MRGAVDGAVPGVDAPDGQLALERVRLDDAGRDGCSSPSFRYSISTTRRFSAPSLSDLDELLLVARRRAAAGVWASSNWPNVSSSFLRTRSSGVCASAAIVGPTYSIASRIARASSGVSFGGPRKTSPYSSLSTRTRPVSSSTSA